MTTETVYDITFDTDNSIMAATLSKPNEVVMLMSSGNVIRFNLDDKNGKYLFSVKSGIGYTDGGFDITAESSIYTMDEIVVIVNDYKTHGFVHYPGKYKSLHLMREGYYADISTFPIALYKDSNKVPHLIYGQAWNHVQIMNLNSLQILTATKSLIDEKAEERHIEFNNKYNQESNSPWPTSYDYFFGRLKISPGSNYFLSEGWIWGSADSYTIYEINNFVKSNRISVINIGSWEHLNRASCWINEQTVAFGYNPFAEDNINVDLKIGSEIRLCKFLENNSENDILKTEGIDTINSKLEFSNQLNSVIVISKEIGVVVISLTGEILFQNNNLKANNYYPDMNLILTINDKRIIINKLIQ